MPKHFNLQMDLVERAYDPDRGSQAWLHEIGSSISKIITGVVSCFAFEVFRDDDERVNFGGGWFEDEVVHRGLAKFMSEAPPDLLDVFHRAPLTARTAGEVLSEAGLRLEGTVLPVVFRDIGIAELLAVPAIGPSGRGSVIGICLDRSPGPPKEARLMLGQLGAHIAAGARLHDKLEGRPAIEHASAVLRTDGELEHAVDEGLEDRALISEAVRQIERARRRETSPQEALELWQGLVHGRWTLADHYEGGGRRYYVAVENPPEIAKSKALTRREAQVVAYLASGTQAQAAAYALGLSVITVRGHLHAALAKLGLSDRAELIGLRANLLGHSLTPKPSDLD